MLQLLDKVEEKHLASDATVVPGGMAMGQREAMKHVGMVPLSKCDREVLAKGWSLLRSVLGTHPRYALDEEQRNWRDCGVSENHIRRSFSDETASLLGIRRNA